MNPYIVNAINTSGHAHVINMLFSDFSNYVFSILLEKIPTVDSNTFAKNEYDYNLDIRYKLNTYSVNSVEKARFPRSVLI